MSYIDEVVIPFLNYIFPVVFMVAAALNLIWEDRIEVEKHKKDKELEELRNKYKNPRP